MGRRAGPEIVTVYNVARVSFPGTEPQGLGDLARAVAIRRTDPILVTGAAGFIGRRTVRHLTTRGWRVRAMVRDSRQTPTLAAEGLDIVGGDMRDSEALESAVRGAGAVVHLAARVADSDDSEEINVGGARRLVDACLRTGCRRIINISSQSTKIRRKGIYAKTKADADALLQASPLDVTTLLLSVVYGEENKGVFGTVLNFVRRLPVIPVLGDGRWISAPVYVGDVAAAIESCLEHPNTVGKVYDIGGPEQVAFDELIDRLCAREGLRRPKVHIPFLLALTGARFASVLLAHPPFTVSNVLGSNQDTNIDIHPASTDFGFSPITLDAGLARLDWRRQTDAQVEPAPVPQSPEQADLLREAQVLSEHLLGRAASSELCRRYCEACHQLLGAETARKIVGSRRWAVGLFDARDGLLDSGSLLRQKLLIMAAILEASPDFADEFLTIPRSRVAAWSALFWSGARAGLKAVFGIPLAPLLRVRTWRPPT
jgi:NADH dehydrogenase